MATENRIEEESPTEAAAIPSLNGHGPASSVNGHFVTPPSDVPTAAAAPTVDWLLPATPTEERIGDPAAGWMPYSTAWLHCPHCGRNDSDCCIRDEKGFTRACRNVVDYLGKRYILPNSHEWTVFRGNLKNHRAAVAAEVKPTLDALCGRSSIFETRILGIRSKFGKPPTGSGYFTDTEKATNAVASYDYRKFPLGSYVLLNEPKPDLYGLAADQIVEHPKATTSDGHILRSQWLLLDIDSVRVVPVSATRSQLTAAMRLTVLCKSLMTAQGFPAPVEGMSGNGGALLYAIDLENNEANVLLVQRVLHAVHHRMTEMANAELNAQAHVDLTTFNPARISRIFGTMNRKGSPTPRQPHRRARLLSVPQKIEVASIDMLRALAAQAPPEESKPNKGAKSVSVGVTHPAAPVESADDRKESNGDGETRDEGEFKHRLKVSEYLTTKGFSFTTKSKGNWTHYILDHCPFDPTHGPDGEVAVHQHDGTGAHGFTCKHNSCAGNKWQEFKEAVGAPERDQYDPPLAPRASKRKKKKADGRNEIIAALVAAHTASGGDAASNSSASSATHPKFHLTDLGNAQRFAARHGQDMRYVHPWSKWLIWDGRRWKIDDTGEGERLAKETVRSIYIEAALETDYARRLDLADWAKKSENESRVRAMISLARSEPGIAVRPEQLDQDHWALNVLNGALDLRTGQLRSHDRKDLITKLAPVEYDPAAKCPTFEKFLFEIFAGKLSLIDYLRRLCGYTLTGSVAEQILAILWGGGRNGKSTLIEILLLLLGDDYAIKAPRDLFMSKKNDNHPTAMARLHGKRLVVCTESAENSRMDEALVKELTGGDMIAARRMREDYWQFSPTHKAFLVTNHKPEIRGTDDGVWRRQRLIPFTVRFWNPDSPDEVAQNLPAALKQDKSLPDKLRTELPGILAWAVRGCLEWQQAGGLGLPADVNAATKEYRIEQDALGEFLAACTCPGEFINASVLYGVYQNWSKNGGERVVLTQRRFGLAMTERGVERTTSNGTIYRGIELTMEGETLVCGTPRRREERERKDLE